MRKVTFFMLTSVDGYFEGPQRELDWHHVDEEFNRFVLDQLEGADTLLFGRVTYAMMASYWPTPAAIQNDPLVAGKMNSLPKIVFSRTLKGADWHNTRLVKSNFTQEVSQLKQQDGRCLLMLGSSNLAVSFLQAGLLDEIRLLVNPLILGSGHPVFHGLSARYALKHLDTRTFRSGNVLLIYEPFHR
jgi:dihydrofolate reductase